MAPKRNYELLDDGVLPDEEGGEEVDAGVAAAEVVADVAGAAVDVLSAVDVAAEVAADAPSPVSDVAVPALAPAWAPVLLPPRKSVTYQPEPLS